MKKTILFLLCLPLMTWAQESKHAPLYFQLEDMPDATIFLPPPPDSTSTAFMNDLLRHMEGKTLRNTPRGQTAIRQAATQVNEMVPLFSEPFGMEISEENTPAIYRLLLRAVPTIRLGATKPKRAYLRTRPYCLLNEPTLVPEEEETLRYSGSYPSGHTVRGWGMALLLTEINPDAQDALLQKGYEWGQSRVIAGYHWQSDIDAGRLLASACFARLHTSQEFLKDMAQARKEYARLKKKLRKH